MFWTMLKLTLNRDSAQNPSRPNLLTQMSTQGTVAFIITWKKCVDWKETATMEDRGGICWHCIKCKAEVFEAQRGQVFVSQCFLCFCCLQLKQQKPHWNSLLFSSGQAHTASCISLQLSTTKRTTSRRRYAPVLLRGSIKTSQKKHTNFILLFLNSLRSFLLALYLAVE